MTFDVRPHQNVWRVYFPESETAVCELINSDDRWHWGFLHPFGHGGGPYHGTADSRDAAVSAFETSWAREC